MAINRLQFGGLLNPTESFDWSEYKNALGPAPTYPTLLGSGVFGDVAGKGPRTQRGLKCPTGTQPNASNTACVPIQKTKVCPDGSLPPCGPTTQRCADGSLPPCGPTTQRCADGSLPPCGPKDKGLCTSGPRAGQRPHPVYGCSDTRQCQYGTYADGRCKPKPLGPDKPGVGITVDGEVVQAPAGHYMPGHVGDPSYYMGADPNWAGGIDYPVTGYTPELIAEQTRMAGLLEGVGQPTDWRNILGGPLSYMDKSTGFDIGEIGPTTRLPTAPLSEEDFLSKYSEPSPYSILSPEGEIEAIRSAQEKIDRDRAQAIAFEEPPSRQTQNIFMQAREFADEPSEEVQELRKAVTKTDVDAKKAEKKATTAKKTASKAKAKAKTTPTRSNKKAAAVAQNNAQKAMQAAVSKRNTAKEKKTESIMGATNYAAYIGRGRK